MANQFKCGRCGTWIDYGTEECPQCGRTFQYASTQQKQTPTNHTSTSSQPNMPRQPHRQSNRKLWAIIALLSILLLTVLIWHFASKGGNADDVNTVLTDSVASSEVTVSEEDAENNILQDDEMIGDDAVNAAQKPANVIKTPFAKQSQKGKRQVVINGEGVRFRFKPSLKAGYLVWEDGRTRSVPKGTKLEYVSETDEWYCVKYKEKTFYVSKEFSYIDK